MLLLKVLLVKQQCFDCGFLAAQRRSYRHLDRHYLQISYRHPDRLQISCLYPDHLQLSYRHPDHLQMTYRPLHRYRMQSGRQLRVLQWLN